MKVLVADDERRVCALICALIEWKSLSLEHVGNAYDGLEALDIIKREKPDLVITDIRMPGLNGLELISKAKAIQPELQFIIISGHKQFDYAQRAIKYGVAEYLLKPIKKQELNQTLQRMTKSFGERVSSNALRDKVKEDRLYLKRTSFSSFLKNNDSQLLSPWITPGTCMRIAIIGIQSSSKESVIHLLNRKVQSLVEQDPLDVCLQPYNGNLYLLYSYEISQSRFIRSQGDTLIEMLKVQAQIFPDLRCTVAIGLEVDDLSKLPLSLYSAKQVLSKRLIEGHHRVYEASKLEESSNEFYLQFIATSFQRCCAQEMHDGTEFCSMLFEKLEKNQVSVHSILNILIQSYKQAEDFAKQFGDFDTVDVSFGTALEEAETLALVKKTYCEGIQHLLELYQQSRDLIVSKPIRIAQAYLQEHYKDEMLSLELVSDVVHLNSSYFSALFKKNIGKGFSEYILELRIQEAKKLLVETNKGIAGIALEVGYHDPKHFAKLFKKVCQIKPNEYRKLYG